LSTCMKCHTEIKVKDSQGNLKANMAELLRHWEEKQPVQWEKVYDLADFVYFDHSRHIAGGVECEECHGKVETMDRVERIYSLKMGWCLTCHREPPTELTPEGQATRAPTYCSTCHR
ncbi:MAG: cytochrome c3 family protein, partial [Planctomycetes bacterium]|nr:cytochrome c3 family protein [Planctomycetota bacterium]